MSPCMIPPAHKGRDSQGGLECKRGRLDFVWGQGSGVFSVLMWGDSDVAHQTVWCRASGRTRQDAA